MPITEQMSTNVSSYYALVCQIGKRKQIDDKVTVYELMIPIETAPCTCRQETFSLSLGTQVSQVPIYLWILRGRLDFGKLEVSASQT